MRPLYRSRLKSQNMDGEVRTNDISQPQLIVDGDHICPEATTFETTSSIDGMIHAAGETSHKMCY